MFMHDLRHGFRILLRSTGFSLVAVMVLALGVGANTAIFSVVNAVLLRPLPFRNPERLVQVWHIPPQKSFPGTKTFAVSPANYLDWKAQAQSFEKLAAYRFHPMNLVGRDRPETMVSALVSAEFFSVLGSAPKLGRTFAPGEDQPGHDAEVVLSDAIWKTRFGGDPNIIGQQASFDGRTFTIVGVMGPEFNFPDWAQVWAPLAWTDKTRAVRSNHDYLAVARLKPGVTIDQARAEMATISKRLENAYPEDDTGWGATVNSLHEELVGDVRPALLVLMGAVAFVLLIACANVANLVLARMLERRKEIAIRSALGASQSRIFTQVIAETILLSLAGGALGLLVANSGVRLIVAFLAQRMPRSSEISLDGTVLLFTFFVSVVTGVLSGFFPAWRLTQVNLNEALKQGLGKTDSSAVGGRTRGLLVGGEIALSLVLLISAGLMIRSLWLLRRVDSGMDSHNVMTAYVGTSLARYPEGRQQTAFFDRVLQGIRALPGVESAGFCDNLPLTGGVSNWPITIEGRPAGPLAEQPEVIASIMTPGYLPTLRIPLLRGRDISDSDTAGRPGVVVISESMARRFWPNEDPIGKHITSAFFPESTREVIGIVGDVKLLGLDHVDAAPAAYFPLSQIPVNGMSLVVRTQDNPELITNSMRDVVQRIDADQPVVDVDTMDGVFEKSLSQQRFSMLLMGVFAGLALLLAATGIYSVLSYTVKRRTREIGIRMALGARIGDILRMVSLQGMRPAFLGTVGGLAGALALAHLMRSLIFGIRPIDPLTFTVVPAVLVLVALVACLVPAYRATQVDPLVALRDE